MLAVRLIHLVRGNGIRDDDVPSSIVAALDSCIQSQLTRGDKPISTYVWIFSKLLEAFISDYRKSQRENFEEDEEGEDERVREKRIERKTCIWLIMKEYTVWDIYTNPYPTLTESCN